MSVYVCPSVPILPHSSCGLSVLPCRPSGLPSLVRLILLLRTVYNVCNVLQCDVMQRNLT